jgi:FkbM family methyltransferase
MTPEQAVDAILIESLPQIDPRRSGVFIEIGCGTIAFSFEVVAKLGYRTFAVEPLITPPLQAACQRSATTLVPAAISDSEGQCTFYIGQFQGSELLELSSIHAGWWGAAKQSIQVPSHTLQGLFNLIHPQKISAMKLDVEGAEPTIIQQFSSLDPALLPQLLIFEYGGGATYAQKTHGWSQPHLAGTLACLKLLKSLGYKKTTRYDSKAHEKTTNLADLDLVTPEDFFAPDCEYGNLVCFRGR